jgi:hypothetical protein
LCCLYDGVVVFVRGLERLGGFLLSTTS